MKAEVAYLDWSNAPPSERPLAAQRPILAKVLFQVLKAHGVSRLRFADMIGVNEKQVRKMLNASAPIPMAALSVMPVEMALDFMDRVIDARGGGAERAGSMLRRGVAGLSTAQDRAAALQLLLGVASKLAAEAK